MNAKMNPYETCPAFENERYLLRCVKEDDAADLLLVYSDEIAVPFFNANNCGGEDFHYTTLERMEQAIRYWKWEYDRKGFVRWSIVEKENGRAVGTIELFNRQAQDYFDNCGLLRLDLRSDYEKCETIADILSLIVPPTFLWFDCEMIATKIPPFAGERRKAAESLGFSASEEKLVGHDGTGYFHYFVLHR